MRFTHRDGCSRSIDRKENTFEILEKQKKKKKYNKQNTQLMLNGKKFEQVNMQM